MVILWNILWKLLGLVIPQFMISIISIPPFSVNPVEVCRRTRRTVAHGWFWEPITTIASRCSPLLSLLTFFWFIFTGSTIGQVWPMGDLEILAFFFFFTFFLCHPCFSSLRLIWVGQRRLFLSIRITTTHHCVDSNISSHPIITFSFHLLWLFSADKIREQG